MRLNQILTPHAIAVAWLLLIAPALCGCGDGLSRAPVHGKVTISGTPLKAGRILFLPVAHAGPTASAAIVDGAYTIPKREGPVLGSHRVEVEAALPLGFALDDDAAFAQRGGAPLPPNPIPPEFNHQSTLTLEVQPGDNEYNVSVPAATARY